MAILPHARRRDTYHGDTLDSLMLLMMLLPNLGVTYRRSHSRSWHEMHAGLTASSLIL